MPLGVPELPEELLANLQRASPEQGGYEMLPEDIEHAAVLYDTMLRTGEIPETEDQAATLLNRDAKTGAWFAKQMEDMNKPTGEFGYAYSKYPHQSYAALPGCKEDCTICNLYYLRGTKMRNMPYSKCFTDKEAKQRLDYLRSSTEENIAQLREYVDQFGDTIFRKWQKLSIKQRTAHVLKAMPGMYRYKGGLLREGNKPQEHNERHRSLHLLPWLNVEAMVEDSARWPSLLYARTIYSPREWTEFDNHQLDYGWRLWLLRANYNPHCVIMRGHQFGQLASWDSAAFHRLDVISFPRAELIFDAQNIMSLFLRNSVSLLIGTNTTGWKPSGNVKLAMLATTGSFMPGSLSLPDLSCATPFTRPPVFDMERAFEALEGRLRAPLRMAFGFYKPIQLLYMIRSPESKALSLHSIATLKA